MVLARVEEWSVDDNGTMGDARVDSHQGWCPGKTTPEVKLLGTSLFWPSLSQPLGRPPTNLYSKTQDYSAGCQCAPGRCITSILSTFLHLLQTSAQTSCPRGRLTGSSVALAIYTSSYLLVIYSVCPGLVVLSKTFLVAH